MTVSVTHATTATGTDAGTGEIHKAEWNAAHTVSGAALSSHTHDGADINAGTVADARIASTLARDSEVIAYAQPLDADLTAIAGLTSAADKVPYFTGSGTAAVATFTSAGRALVDDADAAAQLVTLGVATAITSTKIDDLTQGDDNTDLNASTSRHGLLLKLDNNSAHFVNGQGAWATPAGTATGVATDTIWDAAGDLVQGTGADTGAKLSAGTAGQFLMSAGAAAANLWASRELDYVAFTGAVSITATTEATANTVVTGSAVAYDGSTVVLIEFFTPSCSPDAAAGRSMLLWLYDGSSSIGALTQITNPGATSGASSAYLSRRLTPSNASHTYSVRGSVSAGTGTVSAGAGGTGVFVPGFIRITRAV